MKAQEIKDEHRYKYKNRKRDKKVRLILFWLKFIMTACLFLTTMVLLALSPLFDIKTIEVKGNNHYRKAEIIDASGVQPGINGFKYIGSSLANMVKFRYGNSEKNIIKDHPYIKDVSVRYILPGKVAINTVERNPAAVVPFSGSYLLIDSEACVLESISNLKSTTLPLIKGLNFESYDFGQPVKFEDKEKFKDALRIIKAIKDSDKADNFDILNSINYVDVTDRSQITLLYQSAITVNLGDLTELNYRVDFLKQILRNNIKKEDKGYLDFSTGENPSFVPEK